MNTTIVKPCVKCGAADRDKRGKCRPCVKALAARRYAANPERVKANAAMWRAKNIDRMKALAVRWNAENSELKKALAAKWNAENPEIVASYRHKRRARKLAAGGTFTGADIEKMLKLQKSKCVVCKVDISKGYHIDHVMPLALGGHNGITNIQLLCPKCNRSKGAKHPIDFMQENGFLL